MTYDIALVLVFALSLLNILALLWHVRHHD